MILLHFYKNAGISMNILVVTTSFVVPFQQVNLFMVPLLERKEAQRMRLSLQRTEVLRREMKAKDVRQVSKTKVTLSIISNTHSINKELTNHFQYFLIQLR